MEIAGLLSSLKTFGREVEEKDGRREGEGPGNIFW